MKDIVRTKAALPAGGGTFRLPGLTMGVFLVDQHSHRLAVGSDRRSDIPLMKYEGWLLPAGCEGVCEYDEPLDVLTFEFGGQLLKEVGLDNPYYVAPWTGTFDALMLQMALGADTFLAAGTLYRETMSRAFASHLVQSVRPERVVTVDIDDRRLKRAVECIHDNLAEDLSLESLASLAAMSPFHFARAFKAATGSSPLQYVISNRIRLAKILLKTTKLTVMEIAFRVGYNDSGRFSQHFKKRVGVTPGVFRNG